MFLNKIISRSFCFAIAIAMLSLNTTYTKPIKDTNSTQEIIYPDNDMYLLARLISCEACDEDYITLVGIGSVILNRMESDKFPDSIAGVVFQPGAFEFEVSDSDFENLDQKYLEAAKDAVNGFDPTNGSLYYCNKNRDKSELLNKKDNMVTLGNFTFGFE